MQRPMRKLIEQHNDRCEIFANVQIEWRTD